MPKHLIRTIALVLFVAAFLPGCGGGEDSDDFADSTALEADGYEMPSRGPEWFDPPSAPENSLAEQG